MEPILEIAKIHNLIVVEDACQAHGARYRGKRVGGLGDAAAFSFYPAKNLGAFGDAGVVVTNNERVADYVRMFRDVGQREKYHHEIKGYNHRLDNLQAAILGVKLRYLDEWNAARREKALLYHQLFEDSGLVTPLVANYSEHVWHLYVIRVHERDKLRVRLWEEFGIGTGIHYPIPIHLQPAYRDLGYQIGDLPVTEQCADRILSLPMYPELEPSQIEYVVTAIQEFVNEQYAVPH
jgi:dTDP-4-amino-4,6-dideoxygalactose transaminase